MATDTVYQFLKLHSRPFNVNDIISHNKELSKSAVQQALEKLKKQNKINEKIYGKQKIYCAVMNSSTDFREKIRKEKELMSQSIELESKLQTLEKEINKKKKELEIFQGSLTLDEAIKQRDAYKIIVDKLRAQLDEISQSLSGSSDDFVDKKKDAEKKIDLYRREYLKKKKICQEVLDAILENYPGTKKKLFEEIGIDFKVVS